jgi:hypothetical protein
MKSIGISSSPASSSAGGAQISAGIQSSSQMQANQRFRTLRKIFAFTIVALPLAAHAAGPKEIVLHTYVDTFTNENGGPISGLAMSPLIKRSLRAPNEKFSKKFTATM